VTFIVLFRAEIESLTKEREELMKNLNLAESKRNQAMDKDNIANLQKLLDAKGLC